MRKVLIKIKSQESWEKRQRTIKGHRLFVLEGRHDFEVGEAVCLFLKSPDDELFLYDAHAIHVSEIKGTSLEVQETEGRELDDQTPSWEPTAPMTTLLPNWEELLTQHEALDLSAAPGDLGEDDDTRFELSKAVQNAHQALRGGLTPKKGSQGSEPGFEGAETDRRYKTNVLASVDDGFEGDPDEDLRDEASNPDLESPLGEFEDEDWGRPMRAVNPSPGDLQKEVEEASRREASARDADPGDDGYEEDDLPDGDRGSIYERVNGMSVPMKRMLALKGKRVERALLIRDQAQPIHEMVFRNPHIQLSEVIEYTTYHGLSPNALIVIARNARWMTSSRLRANLVRHPHVPLSVARRIIAMLTLTELRFLAKNHSVRPDVRRSARMALAESQNM